jgi:hypothetical protein
MGGLRGSRLVLLHMVRFGLKHPRLWAVSPFLLIAAGALGLARLSDHYAWGGGTTLLIGLLALTIFVMTVGPITLLPQILLRARVRQQRESHASLDLMEALRRAAHETEQLRATEHKDSVSTPSGSRRER